MSKKFLKDILRIGEKTHKGSGTFSDWEKSPGGFRQNFILEEGKAAAQMICAAAGNLWLF